MPQGYVKITDVIQVSEDVTTRGNPYLISTQELEERLAEDRPEPEPTPPGED